MRGALGYVMRRREEAARRRELAARRGSGGVDRSLLADVQNLAEVVAATIGRLHAAKRTDIARPLEEALDRLGGPR